MKTLLHIGKTLKSKSDRITGIITIKEEINKSKIMEYGVKSQRILILVNSREINHPVLVLVHQVMVSMLIDKTTLIEINHLDLVQFKTNQQLDLLNLKFLYLGNNQIEVMKILGIQRLLRKSIKSIKLLKF
jgi:hypothetical protein